VVRSGLDAGDPNGRRPWPGTASSGCTSIDQAPAPAAGRAIASRSSPRFTPTRSRDRAWDTSCAPGAPSPWPTSHSRREQRRSRGHQLDHREDPTTVWHRRHVHATRCPVAARARGDDAPAPRWVTGWTAVRRPPGSGRTAGTS